jgi:nitrogen fixation NifU-like protein
MEYGEKVLEHFTNPRNVGEMEGASGIGTAGSPKCGDKTRVFLKIEDGVIVDASFKTFGCAAAVASSSMATELIKGKTINEALLFTNQMVVDALGGLPGEKVHCSVLAEDALHAALWDYAQKNGIVIEGLEPPEVFDL